MHDNTEFTNPERLITISFDVQPIAKNALTILVNVSHDGEVLENLASDDAFVETLLKKITVRLPMPKTSTIWGCDRC